MDIICRLAKSKFRSCYERKITKTNWRNKRWHKDNISINGNTIFVYVIVFNWIYFDLSIQWPCASSDTNYGIFCNTCVDILLPAILLSFYIIPPLVKRVKLKKFFQYFTLSSWTFVFVFWFISGIIHSIKVH